MSKPIHVVTDYTTHRSEMREAINSVLPRRSFPLGLAIGFAGAVILVCAVAALVVPHLGS